MNTLVINSSLNGKKGYIEHILNWIKKEFNENEITTRYTKDDRIGNCRGCRNCTFQAKGNCPITDSMAIYQRYMKNSDLIIIGAPIYANFISAKLKTFFERLRPMISGKYGYNSHGHFSCKSREDVKYNILVVSICGFPEIENFEPARIFFETLFERFEFFKNAGGIFIPAFPFIKDKKPELLDEIKKEIKSQINKVKKGQKAFLYKEWVSHQEYENYLKETKFFQK